MTAAKIDKTLAIALERCLAVKPKTLEEFLGGLLDEEPEDLARLPGTPGTVLAAQFTCYAKSSAKLAEVLRRQNDGARQLSDALWRTKPLEEKKSRKAAKPSEVNCDSDPPADKRCRACAACA